jgi:hypothetical protein
MKKTRHRKAVRLPAIMTELMFSSFETIARRSWMAPFHRGATANAKRLRRKRLT